MALSRYSKLRMLRRYNRFRRHIRRWSQRHLLCIRDWLKKEVKRGRDNTVMTNSHYVLWQLTALWLILLGVHLVNYNFHLFNLDRILRPLQSSHFFVRYVGLAIFFAVSAFLREIFHEMFRIPRDTVRSTRLIRRWFTFYLSFWIYCQLAGHRMIVPHGVQETTQVLGALLIVKWSIRKIRITMGLPVGAVLAPGEKKARSAVQAIIKAFLRSRSH